MESSGLAYYGPEEITTEDQLIDRLLEPYPLVTCDVETISTDDRTLIGIGIGLNRRESVYFRIWPDTTPHVQLALRLLDQAETVVWHNGIFDLTVLLEWCMWKGHGHRSSGPWMADTVAGATGRYRVPQALMDVAIRSHDTILMLKVQGLIGELQATSHYYAHYEVQAIRDILPQRKNMLDLPWDVVAHKCLLDVLGTYRLWETLRGPDWGKGQEFTWTYEWNLGTWGCDPSDPTEKVVTTQMQECYDVDRRLIPLLLNMTARGIALRKDRVTHWYQTLSEQRLFYSDICTREGFNPSSPQQVGYVLAARGNILPFTKSRRQLKTDDEVLSMLTDPLATVILEHRKLTKLLGTYFRPYLGRDRAYTHFKQDLSTSRLSSYDRNLMNVPDVARDIFEADAGLWSWLDYNQLEMRIMAAISEDPRLQKVFEDPDGDVHWETQHALWPNTARKDEVARLRSKTFNFAMQYRANPFTLAKHTKLSLHTCKEYREAWLNTYSGVDEYQQSIAAFGWEHGWVENLFGRRCRLPTTETATPDHIEKCAINYPIQSTGADIVKRAMLHPDVVGMDQALQVHDEILVDGVVEFPKVLENLGPLFTPFKGVKYHDVWHKGAVATAV